MGWKRGNATYDHTAERVGGRLAILAAQLDAPPHAHFLPCGMMGYPFRVADRGTPGQTQRR